ncbi:MAG TPA: SGNH/GDSL hydrolase family protein [Acidobacteriaceae bacterium]
MRLGTLLLATSLCAIPSAAFASSFTGIVTFGDSLSDAGNVSLGTAGALPGPGYATRTLPFVPFPVGYYTNPQSGAGPAGLWIDQLAGQLGLPDPTPFLAPTGGTNYAIGSSFTAGFNGIAPGMDVQVADFLASVSNHAPGTDLYTFWGGANDITSGLNPIVAADNIEHEIEAVAAAGGKNFLWLNLPPLGDTPGLRGTPLSAGANLASLAFDTEWATDLTALSALGIDVTGVNIAALFNAVNASPATYGLTDTTHACNATPGCNPNTFLYWDTEHPTTQTDSLVASLAYADLVPTPEPSSISLVALGAMALFSMARARRRQMVRPTLS